MLPFAASAEYYSRYLASRLAGDDSLPEVKGKDRVRTLIAGGQRLSLPVEGGGAVIKRRDADDAMLSDHGRWQDVHLGALKAVYGRTPFFIHLFPEIEEIYRNKSEGKVADFTSALHEMIGRWLGFDEAFLCQLQSFCRENPERLQKWKERYEGKVDPALSVLDLLFHYGKEAVIALL